jgi:transcription elongation factor Elf1
MANWSELTSIRFLCPLCKTKSVKVKSHNLDDYRDHYRLQCKHCGLHSPGWFYNHNKEVQEYEVWWENFLDTLKMSMKPCIFCIVRVDPWYSKCSFCPLKNHIVKYLLQRDLEIKRIQRKLERV